jgi:glutamate synthase (NADPH/NADH) large chain
MSGSEHERQLIETGTLSAGPAIKSARVKDVSLTDSAITPELHTYRPPALGLYDPSRESDACGVGFIANIKGAKSHQIVSDAINILCNLEHRGATGADPRFGDGAGILVQIPHKFFSRKAGELGFELPEPGQYAVGALFMPRDVPWRKVLQGIIADQIKAEGLKLLGWRDVPTDNSSLGESVKPTEPANMQVFIGIGKAKVVDADDFERRLYILRKQISHAIYSRRERGLSGYYACSLSCRTIIYKGMFLADQLGSYYADLHEEDFESALALVHQRFSTNTFPTWSLAHPFRMVAHNGEINTLRGNNNWMAARQASVESELFGKDMSRLWPISYEGQSDTACFDNALEFLVQGGYSLSHAVMMMIPEAWAGNPLMDEQRRAFYEYHAALMEPWDGPAALAFTDGRQIGATLDRNGLRPARYLVTKDDRIVMASEMGVLAIPEEDIITKWRLQPGKMLLVDLEQGRLIPDSEIKAELAASHPYEQWLKNTQMRLEQLPDAPSMGQRSNLPLLARQQAFGYTQEDITILMTPMASQGEEAAGSMGTDTPISALSNKPKPLYTYFKQNFAQVTNPPIDPIREELVMSLVSIIGPRPNLFDLQGAATTKRLEVRQPILTDQDLEKIRSITDVAESHFVSRTLDTTFHAGLGAAGMEQVLDELCARAEGAVREGVNIIILSDRVAGSDRIPIPALLACAAVHHHLIRTGLRTSVGLVVESGEPREVHHFACLAGYGAEAINPYLAFESIIAMKDKLPVKLDDYEIVKRYIKSIGKGLLKVMSKMGISTYQSYCGAQIFDAVGLRSEFIAKYFTGTHGQIEGVGLPEIAEETVRRHNEAFGEIEIYKNSLDIGGEYAYRSRGEDHAWTAETVATLQHAARGNSQERYRAFAKMLNDQAERLLTLRGLFRIKTAEDEKRKPVPIEEVESAAEIVKRFATGAMSYGSISREAHTTLAIAMNRIGGKSNTGEGGEESDRFKPMPNGDSMRSAIKQIASGRFGVTTEYLVNSDMMQIKMAQGAKPGEGGQLPGHKVDATIAAVRHSTPGVGLISPPPHHDIYSIEDIAQLIYDLKNVNPAGQVSVKLVSEIGVGTVAAGVAKARADHVTIAGFEGGTGASPLTSIKHAGSPWEIGLAETHQTLVRERLRSRIVVQVDGGFRTGRDVVIGALLGADEFGFATAPLIAAGCIMMRKCHLNTCPVGVATQDPVLRKRFTGQPEHVINYFFFVAEEVREMMAQLGYRSFSEMVGQVQMLDQSALVSHWKAKGLDFSKLFVRQPELPGQKIYHSETQNHHLEKVLDRELIAQAQPALDRGAPVKFDAKINSTNRSTGAMLSGAVAKIYGHAGLPEDTIKVSLKGTAGQAFGAWLCNGITFDLEGEANDYVGKGLSGGKIIVRPPAHSSIVPEESIIVGNTVMYGAIEGECYFRGVAGERFAVRNSGAVAVVEGAGDHCCEYMTGGIVVVLGKTGRNFAAGMSGGIAYVLDEDGDFEKLCNMAMVELEPVLSEQLVAENVYHRSGDLEAHGKVDVFANLLESDIERLHILISRHAKYAGSKKAEMILADWDTWLPKFRKVMPVEYRRALKELKAKTVNDETPIAIGA